MNAYREKWVKLRGILFFSDQNEEWNILPKKLFIKEFFGKNIKKTISLNI